MPVNEHLPRQARAIALCAAAMCADGDTIILCGADADAMTDFLIDKHLRILTNSLRAANRLALLSENEVFFTGGMLHAGDALTVAPDLDFIQGYSADRVFIGIGGLSLRGLLASDDNEAQATRLLIAQADEVVVLAASSQLAGKGGLLICGLERVSCLITDYHISAASLHMLLDAGIAVRLVATLH
ncbi:hypothetical protein GJ699_18915 [Duganella sp. FT80W]|uniref:DeoR-like transcriptional repressor C-terminal sensor domain-containing protein n=1 Tax=Duganella guangzhouensis TaxID=2666084 RepID=A0A6I2L2Y1_9BURK|nr:DeoR/GlpR transcriptional regulator [Duganella guangzhouensis]MRW92070.1 hypothetical protein [Duganella guangzhouensis]